METTFCTINHSIGNFLSKLENKRPTPSAGMRSSKMSRIRAPGSTGTQRRIHSFDMYFGQAHHVPYCLTQASVLLLTECCHIYVTFVAGLLHAEQGYQGCGLGFTTTGNQKRASANVLLCTVVQVLCTVYKFTVHYVLGPDQKQHNYANLSKLILGLAKYGELIWKG